MVVEYLNKCELLIKSSKTKFERKVFNEIWNDLYKIRNQKSEYKNMLCEDIDIHYSLRFPEQKNLQQELEDIFS